jgi:hypothetical protein
MSTDWKALCAELVEAVENYDFDSGNLKQDWSVLERVKAALAQPEPQGVSDEAIMQLACISLGYEYTPSLLSSPENGIGALEALTSELLAFARAAIAADRARFGRPAIEPVPVSERLPGPTDEEIEEAAKLIHASMRFAVPDNHYTRDWVERGNSLMQDEARRTARAVLARSAVEPVPVSERLPGPGDCDAEGVCWWWSRDMTGWFLCFAASGDPSEWTHWLPHYALPVPQQEVE